MGNSLQRLNLKLAMALLITPFIAGCLTDYDKPWVIEANGATIEFPVYGHIVAKTVRNSIHGSLTKEQTETLASAMPVVTDAVLFTQFENRYDRLKDKFSGAEATFFYRFLADRAIADRRGGFNIIKDWEITPNSIAFTLSKHMRNESDDGYWGGDEDYNIKIRYHFIANETGDWAFVKNQFIGCSHEC